MEVREPGSDSVWMSMETRKNHQSSKRKYMITGKTRTNGRKNSKNSKYVCETESSSTEIDMQSDQEGGNTHDIMLKTNRKQALTRIKPNQEDDKNDNSITIRNQTAMHFDQDHDDIIENLIENINEQDVVNNNILVENSLLNDDAIQLFMNVLAIHLDDISPRRVLHMSHQHLIRPSTMDRDIAIIGG